jgi:hypothetical protein
LGSRLPIVLKYAAGVRACPAIREVSNQEV